MFHREKLSRRKRRRIEVNSESFFIPGGVCLRTGRHVGFCTVNPMDNQDGLGETLCHLSKARIEAYKTWKQFQGIWSSLNKEDRNCYKQDQTHLFSTTHTAWRVHWWSDMHQDQGLRPRRKVSHKIYMYENQDHLGNWNQMRRAKGETEANTAD